MREITSLAKTVQGLLGNIKYYIDYYQREYRWGEKQVRELIEDLTSRFLDDWKPGDSRKAVAGYGHYFLGSVILSRKDEGLFIVDGQQRLTTLTVLLIYLRNLQRGLPDPSPVDHMIFSDSFGEKSFNIRESDPSNGGFDERKPCLEALFSDQPYDTAGKSESVRNIAARYDLLKNSLPSDVTGLALLHFTDWLKNNVHLVEITAYSDDDAYTIFETMNDRGLSLTPTEMLKGYLLANIDDSQRRVAANDFWKRRVTELNDLGKDYDADCLKAWLRSQYAQTIREHKKGAMAEDFDRLGTEFHRWVRDYHAKIGLNSPANYAQLIERDFDFYSRQYLRLMKASEQITPGLEHVLYNAKQGFTSQYQVLLAPLAPGEPSAVVDLKVRLVAIYLDILLTRRIWNYRSIAYSTMQYPTFVVMRDIRRMEPEKLATALWQKLKAEPEDFKTQPRFGVHQQNRWFVHNILARMTAYIEAGAEDESQRAQRYSHFVDRSLRDPFEVEHIWADRPERHVDEFPHPQDFSDYRNHIGGLLLLPKSFNASYGDLPYCDKLEQYKSQNLLARSLNVSCYDRNPSFLRFINETGLPFKAHPEFKKLDLDARQELYRQIAERIWHPDRLTQEVAKWEATK